MTQKPATYHSPIGASSMHRWANCPGSVKLSEGVPSIQSKYAEEGTKAHEEAAKALTFLFAKDGGVYSMPPELKDSVGVYVHTILKDTSNVEKFKVFIEQWCDLSHLHPKLGGTADCIIYFPKQKLLKVYDYKHGAGVSVEVESNEQLMYYALGALLEIKQPVTRVENIIVQPRCEHPDGVVRRWQFDAIDLMDFAADLIEKAKETSKPNAKLEAGDWCRWCPAAFKCPELNKKAVTLAKEEFSPTLSYDPKKLSHALTWLPQLEDWIKSVREFAYAEAEHGRIPPGFKLVQKRATRKWRDEGLVDKQLGKHFTDNIYRECFTDPKLKSPAQIEKILGKTHGAKEFISEHSVAESSGLTLAPVDDKRPEALSSAKTDFTEVEW